MANYIVTTEQLTATADAIRTKTRTNESIVWNADIGFANEIETIDTASYDNMIIYEPFEEIKASYYLSSTVKEVRFKDIITISTEAFRTCMSLTLASFQNCTTIGDRAFFNCESLTSIYFPNCTTIGISAFRGCLSLESAIFPVCSMVNARDFLDCEALTTISFPACTIISDYGFFSCLSL